jgi:hypothetical protein
MSKINIRGSFERAKQALLSTISRVVETLISPEIQPSGPSPSEMANHYKAMKDELVTRSYTYRRSDRDNRTHI